MRKMLQTVITWESNLNFSCGEW